MDGDAAATRDGRLLQRAAGEPAALGPLYERYAKLVFGLALAILGSREEAEDLAHDVFVSAFAGCSYDPTRGSVGAFLITSTRSRAIDRLRARGRSSRLGRTWQETATTSPRTPFECVDTLRAAARVRAVLEELPRAQRQVLEMAYFQGLSQREIAAGLGTPLGTVKTVSRRALATLGRALRAGAALPGH